MEARLCQLDMKLQENEHELQQGKKACGQLCRPLTPDMLVQSVRTARSRLCLAYQLLMSQAHIHMCVSCTDTCNVYVMHFSVCSEQQLGG